MIEFIKAVIKREINTDTSEMRSFNLVQIITLAGLILFAGVIYACVSDPDYLYYTVLMIFVDIVAMAYVNRTGDIFKGAVVSSLISNLIYMPICFYGFGKLICCVPLYFILGIMYTVILIHGKFGLFLSLFETIYLCIATVYIGRLLPDFYVNQPTYVDYIAIVIALLIVCMLAVFATLTKITQYFAEYHNMNDAHLKVIDAYNSKDIFFANTSHEIRTPLNAIVGTVNLLLDEDLDIKVRENVYNILNSCNALLSITDELMTLSNTDSGDLSMAEYKYDLSEIISDIVNMMSVRLMESKVSLYVKLDNQIPRYLIGDGNKVRQLFINILNNAVKYTKEGKIILSVESEQLEKGVIRLSAEVTDTGIGIKPEVLSKLFADYKRDEDDDEKRAIEGTGLGLSLCKDIVEKMGGDISAESVYHEGSVFRFNIRQKVSSMEPIARVSSALRESAIIFENSDELAENVRDVLSSLNIISVIVRDRMEFEDAVMSERYKYVFISAERYMDNRIFTEQKIENHRIVVISNISKSISINTNCYLITRPVTILNTAMAYNNITGSFAREIIQTGGFICPDAKILVVDDNLTNLEVAGGLLKKYEAEIITSVSGYECLNIIEKTPVDIIFMDYMMPDMNGIDTLNAIRSLDNDMAKKVPVIALTANVVSGAKEMFLEAGFSGYISKPIDVQRLEKVLKEQLDRSKIKVRI